MSDPENFMTRWARRKREVAQEEAAEQPGHDSPATDRAQATGAAPAPPAAEAAEPVVDLAKLPSLDSITAETDISAFLVPGVPADLKLAALRRAWVADPMIRDFVGLAENAWDFNNPSSIPGFGPPPAAEVLAREMSRVAGNLLADTPEEPAGPPQAAGMAAQPTEAAGEINAAAGPQPTTSGDASRSLPVQLPCPPDQPPSSVAPQQRSNEVIAVQNTAAPAENLQSSSRRGHGGALPK